MGAVLTTPESINAFARFAMASRKALEYVFNCDNLDFLKGFKFFISLGDIDDFNNAFHNIKAKGKITGSGLRHLKSSTRLRLTYDFGKFTLPQCIEFKLPKDGEQQIMEFAKAKEDGKAFTLPIEVNGQPATFSIVTNGTELDD